MADVTCKVCGEPWDTWGVQTGEGDLSRAEYRFLLSGKGCPECNGQPPCGFCGHGKDRHGSILRPERTECRGEGSWTDGCHADCPAYESSERDYTEEHFGSIEGEDAEAWEQVTYS